MHVRKRFSDALAAATTSSVRLVSFAALALPSICPANRRGIIVHRGFIQLA